MKLVLSCLLLVAVLSRRTLVTAQNRGNNELVFVNTNENEDDDEALVEEEFTSTEKKPFDLKNVFIPSKEWQEVRPGMYSSACILVKFLLLNEIMYF